MQLKESYEIIWEKLLPELENSISTIHYTTFIQKLVPIDLVGTTLVLLANNTINSGMAKTLLVDKILSSSNKLSLGITNIEIFDIYTGGQLAEQGKKSMAYHLTFSMPDRSLTIEEVDKTVNKILNGLNSVGIELR